MQRQNICQNIYIYKIIIQIVEKSKSSYQMYAKKQKNSRKIDEHQSFEEQIFGFHENETLKSINVCFFKKKIQK